MALNKKRCRDDTESSETLMKSNSRPDTKKKKIDFRSICELTVSKLFAAQKSLTKQQLVNNIDFSDCSQNVIESKNSILNYMHGSETLPKKKSQCAVATVPRDGMCVCCNEKVSSMCHHCEKLICTDCASKCGGPCGDSYCRFCVVPTLVIYMFLAKILIQV
eukprot:GHVL01016557.1.p1 GENE.GHVL01016557.1~~GHVL01016557.1.p1  ORF type:complete len:162 (-),score=21.69 GHVL01016557.1:550-1035(-)